MSIARILNRLDDQGETYSSARMMVPKARKTAALHVLNGANVTKLAAHQHVSRKFLYDQQATALDAIDAAFKPSGDEDERVLFTVKVTKTFIKQIVLALVLRCHASFRGVMAFLADIFAYEISLGGVHNIVADATWKARLLSQGEHLGDIKIAAHDEIYQAHRPVLVGIDSASTYCYLLEAAESCDSDTWGYHLLSAKDKGLSLDYVVADQGGGQRRGLAEAFPGVPCGSDIFHVLRDYGNVVRYYENIHKGAYTNRSKVEAKIALTIRRGRRGSRFSYQLARARQKERSLESLVDDLTTMLSWLRHDVLAVAGMTAGDRSSMYDFIVAELKKLEPKRAKVGWLRRRLENAKAPLLAFVDRVDEKLKTLALDLGVAKTLLDQTSVMLGRGLEDPKRYDLEAELRRVLRGRFHEVVSAVRQALESTPRASSIVENLNSILRSYFFLRRDIGGGYLDLLRFYLNHRILEDSECPERQGKTPRQVLTGETPIHWLELLGFQRFQRAA